MSIAQIAPFLTGIPTNGPQPTHYFMYGHHFLCEEFQEHLITAKKVAAMGFLKKWTWHINERQEPNIRYTFKDPDRVAEGPVIAPATKFALQPYVNGTFGLVLELTPELKMLLEERYDVCKVAMVQEIHSIIKNPDGSGAQTAACKALVYWDPLYTADRLRHNVFKDPCEREKWKKGLLALKYVGAPEGWVHAILRRLRGESVDPEPLFSTPIQPKPLLPFNREHVQRAQHNYEHGRQPTPQTSSPSLPLHTPSSPLILSPRSTMAVVQQQGPTIQARIEEERRAQMPPPPRAQPCPAIQARRPLLSEPIGQDTEIQNSQHRRPLLGPPMVQQDPAVPGRVGLDGRPIVQRNPKIQSWMGEDGQPLIVSNKRKVESEDRLTKELKRIKKDGHIGGKPPLPK